MSEDQLAKVIAVNVRDARKKAGLTQSQLSDRTAEGDEDNRIAVPHISRLEKGAHLPSVDTLRKVANALKVPICRLLDPPASMKGAKKK